MEVAEMPTLPILAELFRFSDAITTFRSEMQEFRFFHIFGCILFAHGVQKVKTQQTTYLTVIN